MQHFGDITKINGFAVPIADCVVGGSPCQNLSVAGNREGLLGEESQLFHEQIRIVKEMRENDKRNGKPNELISPRYMVWENVPGAFSSNKGEDFRTVLEEVARVIEEGVTIPRPPKGKWATTGVIIGNGWSIAWRVFDAQYWGVPQRRRRICLVADFNGHTAPQIVFGENQYNGSTERGNSKSPIRYLGNQSRSQVQSLGKGLSGYPNESGEKGQDSSTDAQGGFGASNIAFTMQERGGCDGGGKGALIQEDKSASLRTSNWQTLFQPIGVDPYNAAVTGDKASTIGVNCGMTTGRNAVMTYRKQAHPRNAEEGQGYEETDKADALNVFDNTEKRIPICIVSMDRASFNQGKNAKYDMGIDENGIAHSMVAKGPGAVAYMESYGFDQGATRDVGALFLEERSKTIANGSCPGHHNGVVIKTVEASAYNLESMGVAMQSSAGINSAYVEQTPTLVNGTNPGWQVGIVTKNIALEGNGQRPSHHGDGYLVSDKSYTLNTTEVHGVAYGINGDRAGTLDSSYYKGCGMRGGIEREVIAQAVDCRNCTEDDTNGALQSNMAHSLNGNNVVRVRYIVRRLTPLECERLQGFPDGWTDIGEWIDSKGKVRQTSDAARYKALGNSIALPSWKWIIRRISAQYERDATMVSLFDGIGGFPHLWEQINGNGSCLWASEIDDFPMAVTKKRIG
jgi:DNA (cytosine-5)-methyltransferase 1